MTLLSLALLVPWVSGVVLVVLDGRKRWVATLAIAALVATLGCLVAVAATAPGGRVSFTTGNWPPGVGITFHADALGLLCLLYTSPSPRDTERSRMPSSA